MTTQATERRTIHVAEFERTGRSLPAFKELRRKAIDRFAELEGEGRSAEALAVLRAHLDA